MSFTVRWYQKGDENDIVDLLDLVFGGWPKFDLQCSALDHWLWKYEENLEDNTVSVAVSDGKIIGCLHIMKTGIKIGETIVIGEQGADLAVHPDYRGKGVYNKMNDMFSDLNLAYSVSGNPIVYNKAKRLGDSFFPKPISFMVNIQDVDKHFTLNESEQAFLKKYGFKTLKFFYETRKKIVKEEYENGDIKIKETYTIGEEIDLLWGKILNNYDFIIPRDNAFLNWRFIDERSGKYNLFYTYKDSDLVGYMVLIINFYNKEYPVGTIVDMISIENDNALYNEMFNYAVSYFREKNVNSIEFFSVKDTPTMKSALRHGFIPAPIDYRIFFAEKNRVKTDIINDTDPNRLHFTFADTDHI